MVLALVLLAGVMGAFVQGRRIAIERLELTFDRSSASRRNLLQRDLEYPLLVPEILATSKSVRALLVQPSPVAATEQSGVLEETARNIRVDVLYLLDLSGTCLAASNWRAPDSFVGHKYDFRPYFQQAIAGRTGRYTAKGVVSFKLGHFLARPVMVDGKIRGAVVAKISFDALQSRLQDFWRQEKELDLVTDENGVVVVSPLSAFAIKAIQPIPEATRKVIEASRQYGNEILPISLTPGDALTQQLRFVEFTDIPNQSFLQRSYQFPDLGLQLYLHLPASRYWEIVTEFTAMFSLVALVIFLVCISFFQRWVYGAKLIEAAIRDPLTGLNTRMYMDDWGEAAVRAHNRDPRSGFGLVVFDLDLFKQVNDVHGHLAGDDVLRRVGEIVRNAIRGEDLAVRFGGEELAVFVHCTDPAEAAALAERIRHSVEQSEFQCNTGRIPVTLSGGVAYHAVGETLDALFARADKKLYEAKESGRNRIKD
jgi:two-component system C4-dicarboxylate transport sensor histidine kinase DctB